MADPLLDLCDRIEDRHSHPWTDDAGKRWCDTCAGPDAAHPCDELRAARALRVLIATLPEDVLLAREGPLQLASKAAEEE